MEGRKYENFSLLKKVISFSLHKFNDPKPEKTSSFEILLYIFIELDSKNDFISENL